MFSRADPAPVYLDYQASTPVDSRVLDAMLPSLTGAFGNPSSLQHAHGRDAADAVESARRQVATLINGTPSDVVFTSGATEANNLAIKGALTAVPQRRHIVSCVSEHPAVLAPLAALAKQGYEVTYLSVDGGGRIDLEELAREIRDDTALVTIMVANNELGTLHPLQAIVATAHASGAVVHADGAQAVGKVPVDVRAMGVDLLSVSGHKVYGPQGVGALYVRRDKVNLAPQIHGGGQEGGLRSGTLNTPGCVGLGAACAIAAAELPSESQRVQRLRDALAVGLRDADRSLVINGPGAEHQLPGCLHVTLPGTEADAVMARCADVAMASGSACASSAPTPSHVLRAVGMNDAEAEASLRLSVGRYTTEEDIEVAVKQISASAREVRVALAEPSAGAHA